MSLPSASHIAWIDSPDEGLSNTSVSSSPLASFCSAFFVYICGCGQT